MAGPLDVPWAMLSRTRRQIRRHVVIYAGLAPFLVIALFPVLWMLITAFKDDADLYRMDVVPFWFNLPPLLRPVPAQQRDADGVRGAETLGIAIFVTYLVPPIILFLPLAQVVGTLGLFDSWWALALV